MLTQRIARIFGREPREGNFLAYAIGETALIVAGILIALWVDDWNESRKQQAAFRDAMERVYNAVVDDLGMMDRHYAAIVNQLDIVKRLRADPGAFEDAKLPHILYFLDQPRAVWAETHWTAVRQDVGGLEADPSIPMQLRLADQLADYLDNMAHDEAALTFGEGDTSSVLAPLLRGAGIPESGVSFTFGDYNDFASVDRYTYTPDEIARVRALLADGSLDVAFRTLLERKVAYLHIVVRRRDVARSMRDVIVGAFPDVRLTFDDISITGPGLGEEGARTWRGFTTLQLPPEEVVDAIEIWTRYEQRMSAVPGERDRWTFEGEFFDGPVKWRSRGSWDENWGGDGFPEGNLVRHGPDIRAPKGRFRVELDLAAGTYSFTAID